MCRTPRLAVELEESLDTRMQKVNAETPMTFINEKQCCQQHIVAPFANLSWGLLCKTVVQSIEKLAAEHSVFKLLGVRCDAALNGAPHLTIAARKSAFFADGVRSKTFFKRPSFGL